MISQLRNHITVNLHFIHNTSLILLTDKLNKVLHMWLTIHRYLQQQQSKQPHYTLCSLSLDLIWIIWRSVTHLPEQLRMCTLLSKTCFIPQTCTSFIKLFTLYDNSIRSYKSQFYVTKMSRGTVNDVMYFHSIMICYLIITILTITTEFSTGN